MMSFTICTSLYCTERRRVMLLLVLLSSLVTTQFAFQSPTSVHNRDRVPRTSLFLSTAEEDTSTCCTIQILMSDTGGGHRASANALRDAFKVLHETEPAKFPLPIVCDIVDIYTDYGRQFPSISTFRSTRSWQ